MPPKKRKGRSSAAPSSRRNNRRSTSPHANAQGVPKPSSSRERRTSASLNNANGSSNQSHSNTINTMGNGKLRPSSSKYQSVEEEEAATKRAQEISESYTMHTITHHTSFIPTTALQYSSLANHCRIPGTGTGAGAAGSSSLTCSTVATKSTSSSSHGGNNGASNTNTSLSSSSTSTSRTMVKKPKSKPYALYHPRNLGLLPPTIVQPSNDYEYSTTSVVSRDSSKTKTGGGIHLLHSENTSIERTDLNTPHSAGCRMKFLTQPTFHHLPPSSSNPHYMNSTVPTVMASGGGGGVLSINNENKYAREQSCEGMDVDMNLNKGTASSNENHRTEEIISTSDPQNNNCRNLVYLKKCYLRCPTIQYLLDLYCN